MVKVGEAKKRERSKIWGWIYIFSEMGEIWYTYDIRKCIM